MKKLRLLMLPALMFSMQLSYAQDTPAEKGKVGKAINKVGNKTAEVSVKAASAVVDKKYDGKVGPQGQAIYINKDSRYYYVNKRGKKVFVSKMKLRDNPKK